MKSYGTVKSTVKPESRVIDDYSVWIASDIKEVTVANSDGSTHVEYEYQLMQYSKDEYIAQMNDRITELQEALCDVYEAQQA